MERRRVYGQQDARHPMALRAPVVRIIFVVRLSYNTARHIQEDRPDAALVCILRGLKTRYFRLMLPVMCISLVSIALLWSNAYTVALAAPGYLAQGVARPMGGVATDIWYCIWGSLVEVWVWGWQPAHSSLWCMKPIILGSYFMYLCWLVHGGQRGPLYSHWAASLALLLSREAAAFGIVDCSGTILGGVVAYHIVDKTKVHQGLAGLGLILGLFMASFPIGEPNVAWCHWMFTLASKLMRLDQYSKHNESTCALWYNIAAFLIVVSITQLEQVQRLLSVSWLQATGTVSFALFLIHPLVFWTVGAATYLAVVGNLTAFPQQASYVGAAMMFATSMPVSWFASVYWHRYNELPSYQLVRKWLIDQKEAWLL